MKIAGGVGVRDCRNGRLGSRERTCVARSPVSMARRFVCQYWAYTGIPSRKEKFLFSDLLLMETGLFTDGTANRFEKNITSDPS